MQLSIPMKILHIVMYNFMYKYQISIPVAPFRAPPSVS